MNCVRTDTQLTGRKMSRNHQIAWLVMEGDDPKMIKGSQRTRHSQMVHMCDKDAAKRDIGGGDGGAMDARI